MIEVANLLKRVEFCLNTRNNDLQSNGINRVLQKTCKQACSRINFLCLNAYKSMNALKPVKNRKRTSTTRKLNKELTHFNEI